MKKNIVMLVLLGLFVMGPFKGWTGHTVLKLSDGSRWKQVDFSYCKDLMYRPKVKLFETISGTKMEIINSMCDSAIVEKIND